MDLGKVIFICIAVSFSIWLVKFDAPRRSGAVQKARPILGAVLLLGLTLAVMFT